MLHPECVPKGPALCAKSLAQLTTSDFAEYRNKRLETISARSLSPTAFTFTPHVQSRSAGVESSDLGSLEATGAQGDATVAGKASSSRRIRIFFHAAQKCRNPLLWRVIVLSLETAMRRSETLNLKWHDVELERRCLVVKATKNGYLRRIPLSRTALSLLESLPRDQERVFPITTNSVRLAWDRLTKRAGVNDLHFHDLRHEAISRFSSLA